MNINSVFSYLTIIIFSPLIGKLIKSIVDYLKVYKESKVDSTLLQLLYRLTPREFEIWCSEYLSNLGFSNIILLSPTSNNTKDIICNKDSIKYYVKCKKCLNATSITINDIEELLSSMIIDNIYNGLIITTGTIPDNTKEITKNINSKYNIEFISAEDLNYSYSKYITELK